MRTIAIHTPFGRALSFVELKGVESLSSLYEYRLVLTSKNPNLAATDIIGQTIAVTIDTKGGERVLNGLVTDFGYLSEDEDEQSYHLYTCIMRPNMWYLTQRHDSRVFVDKDILEITRIILDEFGFPYEIQCLNSYRKYGHSTQYQETSFNYLNRLFEQEGLYYYFDHTEGNNTLIIVDDNSAHSPIQGRATIPYHSAVTPGTPDKNYIDIWQQSDRLATKKVNVNDHSYKLANRKLDYNMSTHELGGITTEHYDFYTGFATKDDAATYAQVRSQDYNAQSKRVNAAGNVLTIAPGHTFTLSRHPHNAANTEHLIIHSEYDFKEAGYASGTEQSHYRISFTAIPISYQYRAPRVTPKPQIIGSQGATVTGPAGEEVHTNAYGDIKVQFHWDRYGPRNQKSSDWIRVAQGSAGGSFGSINTPRIGEEVLIDFINGDSDRPIVIGRLYNSANPPPWGYPQAAKQSGIKSKSFNSPLDNYNELMFNDDAGFELVNLQAQRDLNSLVKNDERRRVNRDRTTTIDKDETITVHGKRTEVVDLDEHITIHQNRTEVVDKDETITIHNNRKERVDDNETIDIGGNRTETVHKSEQITIKGNRDKTVKGNDTLNVNKDRKENIDKSRSLTVDRTNTEFVKLGKSVTVGLGYVTQVGTVMNTAVGIMQTEQVGRIKKSFVGKSYSITAGDEFKITVGKSSLVMNADGSIIITGSSIVTQAEKENKVIGKDVLINPPGASNSQVEEAEPDYLNDEPGQRGPDGLMIQGSDSDEMTDEELYAMNDQMIEESIASGGLMAGRTQKEIEDFRRAARAMGGPGRNQVNIVDYKPEVNYDKESAARNARVLGENSKTGQFYTDALKERGDLDYYNAQKAQIEKIRQQNAAARAARASDNATQNNTAQSSPTQQPLPINQGQPPSLYDDIGYENPMARVNNTWKGEAVDGGKQAGTAIYDAAKDSHAGFNAIATTGENLLNKDADALRGQAVDKATNTGKDKLIDKAKDLAPKPVKNAWDAYDDFNAVKEKGSEIKDAIPKDD